MECHTGLYRSTIKIFPIFSLFFFGIILIASLSGCLASNQAIQDEKGGGETPEAVVHYFLTTLSSAIQDPDIDNPETRLVWALRLSTAFPPGERVDQRALIQTMLANFSHGHEELAKNQRLIVDIVYTELVVDTPHDNQAHVNIVEGQLYLRWMRVDPGGAEILQKDQRVLLTDVIGAYGTFLPVLYVDGRWFLTEKTA
jgi:hypothetical protein